MKIDLTSPSLVTDVESTDGESVTFVGSIQSGGSVSDNATLSGDNGPISGTVSFFACFAAQGTPDCTSGGIPVGDPVTVSQLGTATSGTFAPETPGTYCFRAEYAPDAVAPYSLTVETNVVIESDGNHGECFTVGSESNLLNSSVATEVHNASGVVDSALVGSTVFDVAIVSGRRDGGTPTGSVTFAGYLGTGCSGEPVATETVDLVDGTASSDEAPVSEGGLSFRVHYNGSDVYNPSDGICENLSSTVAPPPPPPPPPAPPAPPAAPPATPAPPAIDLAIAKSGSPNPATLGNSVTWTETVTNNGPDAATGVKVADPLPAGMTFVSATSSPGTCPGRAVVSCNLGSLAKGASVTITIVTTASTKGSISNTATVVGNEAETNTANNTATASVVVQCAFTPKPPVRYCTAGGVATKRHIFVGRQ